MAKRKSDAARMARANAEKLNAAALVLEELEPQDAWTRDTARRLRNIADELEGEALEAEGAL